MTNKLLCAVGLAVALAGATAVSGNAFAAVCDAAAETPKITLMADWLPWASSGPSIVAQQKGFYKEEGLDVEIIAPANPADPIKLVARNRVQFSMSYVPEVLMSRDTGIPVVAVAAHLRKYAEGMFYLDETQINGPADLKGKTLGVLSQLKAQAYVRSVLKAGGLTEKDVNIVDPVFAAIQLLVTKKIDAAHGLYYAERVIANDVMAKEGKKPVKWLSYTDYGVPAYYFMLLVANEDWIKKNQHATCRFLRATEKGAKAWIAEPQAALDKIVKANEIFTPSQHRGIYDETKTHWLADNGRYGRQDTALWQQAIDFAVREKLITVPAAPGTYFTNAYLPK